MPSRLWMALSASGPGPDKDIDKRGGFWYSTKVPCANDTRWCGAMAAQLICNQWVAGSTPVTSSKKSYDIPLKSGVCRGAFAFVSPTASPPFRKIMPPGGARVLKSAHHDAAVVFGGVALSGAFAPRPGCGSQRLLRCRLHPAGRCPNSSSLFPPLAAVVAVAPRGGALGRLGNFLLDAWGAIWRKRAGLATEGGLVFVQPLRHACGVPPLLVGEALAGRATSCCLLKA